MILNILMFKIFFTFSNYLLENTIPMTNLVSIWYFFVDYMHKVILSFKIINRWYLKLTVNEKLVSCGNRILISLVDRPQNKNQVIKETGSVRKRAMLEVIPFLIKANFVTLEKNKKQHKQKEFLVLTKLGQNWATFLNILNQFDKDFEKLIKNKETNIDRFQNIYANTVIRNYITDTNNTNKKEKPSSAISVRDNLLRENGWTAQEISKLELWRINTHKFIHYIIDFVIEIIIYRYHKFLIGHEINHHTNKYILYFIENITSFYITKKIQLVSKDYGIETNGENSIIVKMFEENEFQKTIFREKYKERLFGRFGDFIISNCDNKRIKDHLQKISQDIIFMMDVKLDFFESELEEMKKDSKLTTEDYANNENNNQLIMLYKSLLKGQ